MLWSGQGFAEAVNGNNLDPTSMPSSSLTPRRIMLVPLPLIIQRFLRVASDSVPTLTLLSFVVIQFLLNIVHYIPAMSFKKWADRSRLVLKSLLDSDYRWEYHQIETLRQRIADLERKNAAYAQEIELAREEQLVLRERLVKQSQDYEPQASTQDAEIKRLMRQLEAQGKLPEETEGLLEALRASETKKRSQFISEEKATYLEKIGALEGRIATLTTERQDAAEEIRKIQESHQSLQQQFDAVDAEKQDVLGRLTAAERREEQLRKDSEVLSVRLSRGTEERDAIHQNLTTEKESLEKEVHDLVIVGQDMEKQLLQAQQELAAAQAQSYTSSILNHQLQGKIKALEEQRDSEKANADPHNEQSQVIEELRNKISELENALEARTKANEELASEMKAKIEEINRLNDIVEHADFRANKLKKPRHPTPPGTIGHMRSGSISARLGLDRERTVSGSKVNSAVFPTNGGSPSTSPLHRAQATLPTINPAEGTAGDSSLADTSGAADAVSPSSGSATLVPPSMEGKHSRRKSTGSTRRRLSSILGIHMGSPEKPGKHEKQESQEKE